MNNSLDFIKKEQKELSKLGGISSLLGWDQMTYMPKKGVKSRSEQSSMISRMIHDRITSDRLWKHVNKLSKTENLENLNEKDKAIVKRLRKDVKKARKVPSEFIENFSKTTTMAYSAWEKAKGKNDFSVFSPHLEKIVKLEKEYCGYIDRPGHMYNSLLDDYEEGMTVKKLKKEFSSLKKDLIDILNKIVDSERYKEQKKFDRGLDKEKQKRLCNFVLKKIGLPDGKTRLDVSPHPFTVALGYNDVRVTTNFDHASPFFSFFSTIHEAGHALYELGMPRGEFEDTVISGSPSLGMHESQSRFWENMIARNKSFWKFLSPILNKEFSSLVNGFTLEDLYFYVNQVSPSLIRVESDELTYCLHIILRFELEIDLVEGNIGVEDLPYLWNEKMDDLLGVVPDSDREGVLQDMHWSTGDFGYFPTYAIGSIYSSQLFKEFSESFDIYDKVEKGDFSDILSWLRNNVHSWGRLLNSDEIINRVCGEGLNSDVFSSYLSDKYFSLYDV